jgi:RsiW-degrading membrane proteinase PrsW (M82 family)
MGTATLKPFGVEHFAKLFGTTVIISRKLNTLIAHLSYSGYHTGQVTLALFAHRIELKADWSSTPSVCPWLSPLIPGCRIRS